MYDNENSPLGETIYEDIPQTPVQPEPEQAPEVAQAAPVEGVEPEVRKPTNTEQERRKFTEEQQQRNFAELRRQQELKDRELDLMRREIEQLRQNAYRPAQAPKDDLGIAKDAFAEVQHVERIVEARLKEQEERYRKQLEAQRQQEAERALNLQYKDLYQVLTQDNLRRLEIEEPEIAASIAANPDTYSAKVAAYKQIKKLGIVEDNYNNLRVQERLTQNAQRPKAPQALAPRQGSQALAAAPVAPGFAETITDDMAARYRKEMEDAISRM